MYTRTLDTLFRAAAEECEQMVDVTMNVSVGQKADEVNRLAALPDAPHHCLPLLALEDLAARNRHLDTLSPLVEHTAGAECVVTDLAVAHVVVARKAHRSPVCAEARGGGDATEPIEGGRTGQPDGVALIGGAATHTIHDDGEDRPLDPRKGGVLGQRPVGHAVS